MICIRLYLSLRLCLPSIIMLTITVPMNHATSLNRLISGRNIQRLMELIVRDQEKIGE